MISLMVFFVFFVILGIKVYTMSKETISHAGMLPLEDASRDSKTNP
jgi:hypothetical protein